MQVEYATDVVFDKQSDLQPVYEAITRTAVHTVKADHVATFLGRKLTGNSDLCWTTRTRARSPA